MYKFNKIIIALDLSKMDGSLLSYAAGMCDIIQPKKVYFINIQPNLDLDDEMKTLIMGDKDQPMDEYVHDKMKKEVYKYFDVNAKFEREYEIVEGNPSNEILRWVKMKDADLLIMGRKRTTGGSGITPQQVSSKVRSSVLIVPEDTTEFKLEHIFIPLDYSEHSKLALEEAFEIKNNNVKEVKLGCTHIYKLPLGFEKSGKSPEEFAEIMAKNAQKKFNKFIDKFGEEASHLTSSFILVDEDSSVAETINDEAHKVGSDLIVVGAKGRTLATQLFMGSVTHKLIKHDSDIPVLVVKDKEHTFDFWDFFKNV